MCRSVVWAALLLCACSADSPHEGRAPGGPAHTPTPRAKGAAPTAPGTALTLSQSAITARLGAHRLNCKSTLQTMVPGSASRTVIQQLDMSVDQKGRFAAAKNTGKQHGQEVIWTGTWLFPRMRHGKFLQRRARAGEPKEIADRMAGYLPAYVKLLAPSMRLESQGETTYQQRKVLRLSLVLSLSPARRPNSSGSRRWRQLIKVQSLKGLVLLDAATGVPLSLDLSAAWSFSPPLAGKTPPSGIPQQLDTRTTGTMKLELSQRVTDVGKVPAVQPPPTREVLDPRRDRLERERQMFSGEIPIPAQGLQWDTINEEGS